MIRVWELWGSVEDVYGVGLGLSCGGAMPVDEVVGESDSELDSMRRSREEATTVSGLHKRKDYLQPIYSFYLFEYMKEEDND